MTYTPSRFLTFEEFLHQYGDNPRYELADGELINMLQTPPSEHNKRSLIDAEIRGWV